MAQVTNFGTDVLAAKMSISFHQYNIRSVSSLYITSFSEEDSITSDSLTFNLHNVFVLHLEHLKQIKIKHANKTLKAPKKDKIFVL